MHVQSARTSTPFARFCLETTFQLTFGIVCAKWFPLKESRGSGQDRAKILAMASGRKPVIVRRLNRQWTAGYATLEPLQESFDLLDASGKYSSFAWEEIKWVCLVRELPQNLNEANPERLLHRRFSARPRTAGVWLRLTLVDGESLEGLAANDRSLVAGPALLLTPPDTRSNTQRILVPRVAIEQLEVVGLVGLHPRARTESGATAGQTDLFPLEAEL